MDELKCINAMLGRAITDINTDDDSADFMINLCKQKTKDALNHIKNVLENIISELPNDLKELTVFEFMDFVYSEVED